MKVKNLILSSLCLFLMSCNSPLPKPEKADGVIGEQLGVDKNINVETIDKYLFRSDSVYRDVRMLIDEASYENIGGDSYMSGFVVGFEVVPYPYLINVKGLPESVGQTYTGPTWFSQDDEGHITANYSNSVQLLKDLFPQDKYIFLMCGGGGYAGMTKTLLVSQGWDPDKIYNVGGYWSYQGNYNVQVKRVENGTTYYDFYKVAYHDIRVDA